MNATGQTVLQGTDLSELETALHQLPELKKVKLHVCQGDQEIRIFLEDYALPKKQIWQNKIRTALRQVQLKTTYPIQVYGRQIGDIMPQWHMQLAPNMAANATASSQAATSNPVQEDWLAFLTWVRQSPFYPVVNQVQTKWAHATSRWRLITAGGLTVILLVFLHSLFSPSPLSTTTPSYALQFDGEDDIAIASASQIPAFDSSEAGFSVSLWVKPTHLTKYGRLIERSDNTSNDRLLLVIDHEEEGIRLSLNGHYAIADELLLNQWSHVVGTYDGQNIRVYLNGELGATTSYRGKIDLTQSSLLVGNNRENSRPFAGSLGDIQIWQKALTPKEIQQVLAKLPAADTPGLLAVWSFDDTTGTVALDRIDQIPLTIQTVTGKGDGPQLVSSQD